MAEQDYLRQVLADVESEMEGELSKTGGELEALIGGLVTLAEHIERIVARNDEIASSQFREGIADAIDAFRHVREG